MLITHKRSVQKPNVTFSDVYINGSWQCIFLEDPVRAPGTPHPEGNTAVPFGKYQITLRRDGSLWKQFLAVPELKNIGLEKGMLHIHNIDGRTYDEWYSGVIGIPFGAWVMIHPGMDTGETLGCPLTGLSHTADGIAPGTSRAAFAKIYRIIMPALVAGEKVIHEIV